MGASTASVDTSTFEGNVVESKPPVVVDFLSVTSAAAGDGITLFGQYLETLLTLQRVCKRARESTGSQVSANLLQIASLVEDTFLGLLPVPAWTDGTDEASVALWGATTRENFVQARDALAWLSAEYCALTLSVKSPQSHPVRVLTHGAIASAFFQLVRMYGASGGGETADGSVLARAAESKDGCGDDAADVLLAHMLREGSGLGFPMGTAAGESFAKITGKMVMTRPELCGARARLCAYAHGMAANTAGKVFDFGPVEFQTSVDKGYAARVRALKGFEPFNGWLGGTCISILELDMDLIWT